MNISSTPSFSAYPLPASLSTRPPSLSTRRDSGASAPTVEPSLAAAQPLRTPQAQGGSPLSPIKASVENGRIEPQSASAEQALAKRRQAQQEQLIQNEIKTLAARDREVRAHEQAHVAAGGQYAGAATYQFERGPNGVNYAVGGEVQISTSEEATPQATLRKAQIIRRAALAPAEPSPQDRKIAAMATQMESAARAEIARERKASSAPEEPAKDAEPVGHDDTQAKVSGGEPAAQVPNPPAAAGEQLRIYRLGGGDKPAAGRLLSLQA